MSKYASAVLAQAKAWHGIKEGSAGHKEILDVYNSHRPLARGHKMSLSEPWCATFVSAVSVKLGYTDIIPTECSCNKMIELLKKIDSWVEDESVTPEPGWILFYDWQDKSGKADNKSRVEHVGFVEKVSGGKITVIEGNYKNAVSRRVLSVNGKYIRGYGAPKYDKEPAPVVSTKIDTVKEVQAWLNKDYKAGLVVDGIYGRKTKAALVKVLQKAIGVTVDGDYGPKTNAAVKNLEKGDKGNAVKALQGLLVCNGYAGAYVDGDFGKGTKDAVMDYQKKNGLTVDGIAGKNTFSKLCK